MVPVSPLWPKLMQMAEKALFTFLEAFATLLIFSGAVNVSTAQAAAIAALPAAISVALASLPLVPDGLPFLEDLTFRVIRTFVATFLGFLIALPHFAINMSIAKAAALAAAAAAIAVVKGAISQQIGSKGTAAALPASLDRAA